MHSLLKDSHLSKKDKSLLLVGIFAARREEQAMLHFTEVAIDAGNTVNEIAELLSASIISRGIPAWLSGIDAISKAIELTVKAESTIKPHSISAFSTQEDCISYYQSEFEQLPKWIEYLVDFAPDILLKYSNLRTTSLRDGIVSRHLKELLLYAINICDQYTKGIEIHETNAIQLGATEEVLQDVRTICIYAVGVQAVLKY
jgi:alkylhydroperoxidase/carboxymuconolactone decarboxylase family protein YurZ